MQSRIQNTEKIDQLIKSMKFLSRFYKNRSHCHYYQMIHDYYARLRDARENGDFVAAHTMFVPVEIFDAMDIVPLHLEFTGYMMSLFGVTTSDVLATAAEMGLAPEVCSGHRLVAGALKMDALPPADAVVGSNLVCDNGLKSGELTMEFNHCPGTVFDFPFHINEAGKEYLMRELNDLVAFLEHASGHTMDWNKLSEHVAETGRQLELMRQINNLCKTCPSPFEPQDFLKFLTTDYMGAGRPEITRYLEDLRNDLSDKAAKGTGFASPERLRLLGLMIPPWYLQNDVDRILKEHDAAIVCYPNLCEWGDVDLTLDPAKPLESLAYKLIISPPMRTFGPADRRMLEPVSRAVKEYKIDGAINFTHLGCRQTGPLLKIYKDLLDEMDIPLLNIDADLVDSTITSADEVQSRMDQFFEMLEDR
ncbi:MAG: 2-hydroxyacyl-CoA dehydratase [Dehalococcoidales bacterium]|nr:2-hydroxyacyl-CoA dehydratase [Dehalococcoidales bacterium]